MSRGCAVLAQAHERRETYIGEKLADGDWIFSNLENIDPAKLREACHAIADEDGVQAYVYLRRQFELVAGNEYDRRIQQDVEVDPIDA